MLFGYSTVRGLIRQRVIERIERTERTFWTFLNIWWIAWPDKFTIFIQRNTGLLPSILHFWTIDQSENINYLFGSWWFYSTALFETRTRIYESEAFKKFALWRVGKLIHELYLTKHVIWTQITYFTILLSAYDHFWFKSKLFIINSMECSKSPDNEGIPVTLKSYTMYL
jgi:hypothetical protein